ncbi:MAG: hypothetical protein ACMXYA_03745 [Candidatus Woesearchaeota archaeon]
MAFDKNLDKELFRKEVEFETSKIIVSVFSYNEGTPKLQLSREVQNPNTGDYSFAKLGRLFKEEVQAIQPVIQEAIEHM